VNLLDNDSTRSNNTLFNFDQTLSSSSSELNLSIASQSIHASSSLLLSALDDQDYEMTDDNDDTSLSITPIQTISDNESVLYLRLSKELNIDPATFDSDLERTDR